MQLSQIDSQFLRYLIDRQVAVGERLPSLAEIGAELGISVGKLREQLEVARSLGVVSVRPRLGIQREPFDFSQSLLNGVLFSLATQEAQFEQLSRLRQVVEEGFCDEAVVCLTTADKLALRSLVDKAWAKLRGEPIHVPNAEHRALHLGIFKRLDNPYVQGILTTYWEAYDASELTRFVRYAYWIEVWNYHEQIVEALCADDFDLGRRLLVEHFSLLQPVPALMPDALNGSVEPLTSDKGEIR
jgi:DNA-binding FadR family transcriptional regulator